MISKLNRVLETLYLMTVRPCCVGVTVRNPAGGVTEHKPWLAVSCLDVIRQIVTSAHLFTLIV